MADSKAFLAWAKEQAKAHGANSNISNISKLGSKYSLSGFVTWGDVVTAAQKDVTNETKNPPSIKKPNSNDLFDTLEAEKVKVRRASAIIDAATPGDADFVKATKDLADAKAKVEDLQKQYDTTLAAEKAAAISKKKTSTDKSSTTLAQSDLDEATAAKQRALAKDPTADVSAYDNAIKIAQDKIDQIKAGVTTAPTGPSPIDKGAAALGAATGTQTKPLGVGTVLAPTGAKGTGSTGPKPIDTSTVTDTSGGGKYTTSKGILNYNGQPFTGQKDGVYYSNGKVESAEQIKQDFFAKFGVQAALIASDPGLSALFTQAIKENWAPGKWGAAFQNSAWAKARNATQQAADIQRISSPQDYAQAYNRAQQQAISTAAALGFDLTDSQKGSTIDPANMSTVHQLDPTGQDLAEWIVRNNPTPLELNAHLTQVGKVNATLTGGQVQGYAQQLKQTAMDLGLSNMILPPSAGGDYFTDAAKSIIAGTTDINKQVEILRKQAIANYPAYANQIESGITIKSMAAPYINTLSNLLEVVDPSQIDLGSPTGYGAMITKALRGNNDPKNPIPMDLSTFQNQIRSLPQWLNTQNAKTDILGSGVQLLKTFGLDVG